MQKPALMYPVLLTAILGLAACSTEPYTKVVWANPLVPPDRQRIQLKLDTDACWTLASEAIPEPSLRDLGFRMRDRLGWQILNQRDETQMRFVAVCLAQKGWRAEERVIG
jgi:hypothetical protein